MTEDTKAAPAGASETRRRRPATARRTTTSPSYPASSATSRGSSPRRAVVAQGDHALVVARFANKDAAISIYDGLLEAELEGVLHIDGVLVVNADQDGRIHVQKMTDHSTRTGLKWGIVGGVVAAVFLPATLARRCRRVGHGRRGRREGPQPHASPRHRVRAGRRHHAGHVGDPRARDREDAPEVAPKMTDAEEVKTVPVDDETAAAIKEAAKEAEATTPSGS